MTQTLIEQLEKFIEERLKGIDRTEVESPDGWWETSGGADFGESVLSDLRAIIEQHKSQPDIVSELVKALEGDAFAASFQSMAGIAMRYSPKLRGGGGMKSLTRHQFEHIARHYVGMAEFSGYHSTGGVWVYNHNYVNNAWKMWQEFQKLSDERLSDRESEIRAEYTYCTPPEQTIRTQQATIERLTEQRDRLLGALKESNNVILSKTDEHISDENDALIAEIEESK